MEPPAGRDFGDVHTEKAKVFQATRPAYARRLGARPVCRLPGGTKRGQELRRRDLLALRLFIDSWRWEGVPWYLRSGKYLAETATEVLVQLKPPPQRLFADSAATTGRANYLRFRLSPSSAIALAARVKRAGKEFVGDQRELYLLEEQPGEEPPYERLLADAMAGDGASSLVRTRLRPPGRWSSRSSRTTRVPAPTNVAVGGPRKLTPSSRPTVAGITPSPRRRPDDEPLSTVSLPALIATGNCDRTNTVLFHKGGK